MNNAVASDQPNSGGPLAGLKILEFVGIGPGPHCAMLLADLGADVVRIDRPGGNGWPNPIVDRGRAHLTVDLQTKEGRDYCLEAIESADALIEGFRPGVMERLGLGPDIAMARNPRLIYGRLTGWGQTGPLAQAAGHDINYIALAGALAAIGQQGMPATPPLNLVGDFGGGSMLLAFGILAALYERGRSGRGQVIDAAIVDGVSSLMAMFAGLASDERLSLDRDRNILSGAAPFYRCYLCADGREIAIGAVEPQFYEQLLQRIDAPDTLRKGRNRTNDWPDLSERFADLFRTRTVSEWCRILEGSDACFAPVLALEDVPRHPHMAARASHIVHEGLEQLAPVPRFSRTPGVISRKRDGASTISAWLADAPKKKFDLDLDTF